MTTLVPPNWNVTKLPPAPVRRFTVDEYHRMIQTGLLTEDDPVELLEGWIIYKMPRNPPPDVAIDLAREAIESRLAGDWRVRVQSAVTTSDSEPEPDLAVVRGPARRYIGRHPAPEDIALVVEVAGSSFDHDRDVKGPVYAAAGIPVYWVVNLVDGRVEVYTNPSPAGYTRRDDFNGGGAIPLFIPGQPAVTIPARELLA